MGWCEGALRRVPSAGEGSFSALLGTPLWQPALFGREGEQAAMPITSIQTWDPKVPQGVSDPACLLLLLLLPRVQCLSRCGRRLRAAAGPSWQSRCWRRSTSGAGGWVGGWRVWDGAQAQSRLAG